MKFKELKGLIAALDGNEEQDIQVRKYGDKTVIRTLFDEYTADLFFYEISEQRLGSFIELKDTLVLSTDHRLTLQKLAYKYSRTPLDKRRDEPKFRVQMMPGPLYLYTYLNQVRSSKNIILSGCEDNNITQTIFTKSEYENIQRAHPKWLPKFDDTDPHFEFLEDGK